MVQESTSVLIVGGGIVGLSASLMCQKHKLPAVLIERHSGTSIHPRARGVSLRTMEIYREFDLEEEIRIAGAAIAPSRGIYSGETLVDVISALPRDTPPMRTPFNTPQAEISPAISTRITQDLLEPILANKARQMGGDLRFSTELVSFVQDANGVTATVRDRVTGIEQTIQADYMIAADGASSPVRHQLGISTSGRGTLGYLLNILFEADLSDLVQGREFSICLIKRPEIEGLFTSINNSNRWVFHLAYKPQEGEAPDQFPPERCVNLLHLAIGLPDLPIEIKSILPWEAATNVADEYQRGRIFLAGDAAHQMLPCRGQGANTGVADVHNLVWKLALVLNRQASPELLSTYIAERRPIAVIAAEESAMAADERGLLSMQQFDTQVPLQRPRMLGFGYQQTSSAIIADGDSSAVLKDMGLNGYPGTRAPHFWVEFGGKRVSTLDLFDLDACWPSAYSVEAAGATLVRPDGMVAWRSVSEVADPQQALHTAIDHIVR